MFLNFRPVFAIYVSREKLIVISLLVILVFISSFGDILRHNSLFIELRIIFNPIYIY